MSRRELGIIVALFAVTRAMLVIAGLLAMSVLGVREDPGYTRLLDNVPALDMWHRWDAGFYVDIAINGYKWERQGEMTQDMAFLPVYPLAIRAVSGLTPDGCIWSPYWSTCGTLGGVVISNVALLCAAILLFDLTHHRFDKKTAWLTTVLLLVSPISVFLSGVYSESLFLFLTVLTFWLLMRDQGRLGAAFAGAVIAASVASLTRNVGVALVPALLWYVWTSAEKPISLRTLSRFALATLPILAFGAYVLLVGTRLGNLGAFFQGFGQLWGRRLNLLDSFTVYFSEARVDLFGWWDSWIDLFAAIFYFVLALIAFRFNRGWGLFALVAVLIPVTSGRLQSMPRYGAALFPFYILIGYWLARLDRRWVWALVYGGSALAALGFLARFVTWRWIA
jgi:hypothetical protein